MTTPSSGPGEGPSRAVRCLIVDDHPAVRTGLTEILTDGDRLVVVGQAGDAEEGLALAAAVEPDIAVLDVVLPEMHGFDLTRRLLQQTPELRVIIYSGFGDAGMVAEAVACGASGYLLKDAPIVDVQQAVRQVAAGQRYVDATLALDFVDGASAGAGVTLSGREREVLALLAGGKQYRCIGRRLGISQETVRTHVENAGRKLGAATRTHAVAIALRRCLITV
jgi:DNA-binding NarL/FixJ family response regulator